MPVESCCFAKLRQGNQLSYFAKQRSDIYIRGTDFRLSRLSYYSCAAKRMGCKMPSVSFFFWCHISVCKFMLAYINTHDCNFKWGGGQGIIQKSLQLLKNVLLSQKNSWKNLKRSIRFLKCIYAWNISPFCIKTKTVRV